MKPKVLILYNQMLHYRIPIFKLLGDKYDLTVAYNYGKVPMEDLNFNVVKLTPYSIWKFTLQKENIYNICQGFDVVVVLGEVKYLKYSMLALHKKRNFRLVYWGIGAGASYHRKYGEGGALYYAITTFSPKLADAQISYSDAGRQIQIQHGVNPEKTFVADNTVEVPKIELRSERDCIMFIGTLYPQKGLPILLDAYKQAYEQNHQILPLYIVGGGPLGDAVSKWVKNNKLNAKIKLLGALYTAEEKSKIFSKACACISPNQAGLGVLESMGYGVPFITSKDAITGGESFNIQDGKTGLRLDSLDSLDEIILDISSNPKKYQKMGENAFDYYWKNRTPRHMADGLIEAIEYAMAR